MSAEFIYNRTEWGVRCVNKGWRIVDCECFNPQCKEHERHICHQEYAYDKEGLLKSVFKHFGGFGVIYD